MNYKQKILIQYAALVIFLAVLYLFLRLMDIGVNFFVLSIILLGCLFFNNYMQIVIVEPLTEQIGELNCLAKLAKQKALKK